METKRPARLATPKAAAKAVPAGQRLRVESREQLVYLLTQACELEHGLMCEYLFAQWSLKRAVGEGVSEQQLERILAWDAAIEGVAIQEMLHLALAINLLCALGAPPHFDRPNFPILAGWYPPGVQIALVPFSEAALRHFVYLERPENMALDDAEGFAALDHAEPLTDGRSLMAVQEDWATVGELYRGIELGFAHLVERDGEDEVFIGGRRDQARWQAFHWPEITPVVDMPSAQAAIEHIVEQGEGVRGEWKTAHFGTFLNVLNEYRAMHETDPAFAPARASTPAFVHEVDDADAPVALITDPLTTRVSDLFDAAYEITLQALARYFVHTTETGDQLAVLARTARRLMARVLKPLGITLSGLPLGTADGALAGAGFRILSPTFYLLPHRNAAWHVLRHRLGDAATRAEELASDQLPALANVGEVLRQMEADVDAAMPIEHLIVPGETSEPQGRS
jgi:Ferritin-like